VTAAVLSRRKGSFKGIRALDPRRDMGPIADLIESAFPLEFDPAGRRMVRDMRTFGTAGILGYWIGRIVLPPAAYPLGFVWEQDGDVVGNASLLRVDGFPRRWVLANVVVREDYRRKGIGRELTRASIELARARKAKELFLQVDSTKQGAQILYASLGFHPHGTRGTWVISPSQRAPDMRSIGLTRERRAGEWKAQLDLAKRLHPEGLVWPYPLTSSLYRHPWLQRVFRVTLSRHWVWTEDNRLMGSLTTRAQVEKRKVRFILLVDPEMRGTIERPLLNAGLGALHDKQKTIVMDYPAGFVDQELRDIGFTQKRTLTWMSKDL
jgi:ribosomal protein S18 acetylase RimI-like enzyme